jgi:hypothetical protein
LSAARMPGILSHAPEPDGFDETGVSDAPDVSSGILDFPLD